MKIGGRGQWRVDRSRLELWLADCHDDTARWIDEHAFTQHAEGVDDADPPGHQPAIAGTSAMAL